MGGSPCSGKSSIAEILTKEYQIRTYGCDEALGENHQRITPEGQPTMHKWITSPWNELWMQPLDVLVREAISAYREHFHLVVEDLLSLPGSEPTLAEGTCLLPDCVYGMLSNEQQAIWIVPTEEFQRKLYPHRGSWVQEILRQCAEPERAFQNWMDRDVEFARWVVQTAGELGLRVVQVDGRHTIAENAQIAAEHLRL